MILIKHYTLILLNLKAKKLRFFLLKIWSIYDPDLFIKNYCSRIDCYLTGMGLDNEESEFIRYFKTKKNEVIMELLDPKVDNTEQSRKPLID